MPQQEREEGQSTRNQHTLAPHTSVNLANSFAGLVHDARNVVAAIDLYCDLLAEPEVLSTECRHYAADLRLVSGAGRRLLDKLAVTAQNISPADFTSAHSQPVSERSINASRPAVRSTSDRPVHRSTPTPLWPEGFRPNLPPIDREVVNVERVCEELHKIRPLLSAIAGPGISIQIDNSTHDWPIPITAEDLTRILVNLIRNASEAMNGSGHVRVAVQQTAGFVVLSVSDEGPGIPRQLMEQVFQAGFSTRELQAVSAGNSAEPPSPNWPVRHRGLGLSIVRSIVSAARGTVWVADGDSAPTKQLPSTTTEALKGAVIFLEFPLPRKGPIPPPTNLQVGAVSSQNS